MRDARHTTEPHLQFTRSHGSRSTRLHGGSLKPPAEHVRPDCSRPAAIHRAQTRRPDTARLPSGGYKRLRSYQTAAAIYDATRVFCQRLLAGDRRTSDQMVQAARSGVRNISEGSGAAATSSEMEIKLTNVARASLGEELLQDYESFLTQRGMRVWEKDEPLALAMRLRLRADDIGDLPASPTAPVRLRGLAHLANVVRDAHPEIAANALICAIHQATYMLRRQIVAQEAAFARHGGFRESLLRYRLRHRARAGTPPAT